MLIGVLADFHQPLLWPTVTITAFALLVSLWDDAAWFALAGLWCTGLATVGLWTGAAPPDSRWLVVLLLGGFVTLASLCRRAGPIVLGLKEDLGLSQTRRWPVEWFFPAQLVVAFLVTAGSLQLCLEGDSLVQRLVGGPCALVLLLPAVVMLGHARDDFQQSFARYATLGLGLLAPAEAIWALLDPAAPGIWLQRAAGCSVSCLAWRSSMASSCHPPFVEDGRETAVESAALSLRWRSACWQRSLPARRCISLAARCTFCRCYWLSPFFWPCAS